MSRYSAAEQAAIESRRVERVYSVLARVYDDFFDWALGPGRVQAVQRLDLSPGERVLEVGVGTGLSLPRYAPGCRVTGIDISEPMLEHARLRAEGLEEIDVDLRLMDARDLDFEDETFDHVIAPYVISVVPEPEKVMSEICRVVKPGGAVLVVNHFGSKNGMLKLMERAMTPLSQWIGFRLDLPIDVVLDTPGLNTLEIEKVNLLGMWRLLIMRREG